MLLATEALMGPQGPDGRQSVSTVPSAVSGLLAGAGAELALSECRARLALLPSCGSHFCLKYYPGLCACMSPWQASAGTGSLLGLQGAELALRGPCLVEDNCQGQWVSFPFVTPTLGWVGPRPWRDPKT